MIRPRCPMCERRGLIKEGDFYRILGISSGGLASYFRCSHCHAKLKSDTDKQYFLAVDDDEWLKHCGPEQIPPARKI